MGKYKTALARYTYLIQNYPDMGQYHEALEYIGKCKENLAEENTAKGEGNNRRSGLLRKIFPF
jgi:hypothetical protein